MIEQQNSGFFKTLGNFVTNTTAALNQYAVNALEKAKGGGVQPLQRVSVVDNTEVAQQDTRYLERFSFLTDESLNMMANKDVVVAAIINRRCAQISQFARPARKKYQIGYRLAYKDGAEQAEGDADIISLVESFILNTGFLADRQKEDMMNFEEFLRRETRDLMVFDRVTIEKIPTMDDGLYAFLPVDASTIRFARRITINETENLPQTMVATLDREDEEERVMGMKERLDGVNPEDIKFVQVITQKLTAFYTYQDLIFRNFNPSNEVRLNGYSSGPLEKLVAIITSHLFAESHNRFYFTQGFSTRGIMVIRGNIPQQQVEAFRRQWYTQVSGAQNSWRTPILGGEDIEVQWVPLQMNNRDMEWDVWMHYLVKVICALYLIAPQEIGWDVSTTGAGMISGDSGKRNMVLLTESKDVGLVPILRFFENLINEEILPYFGDDVVNRFEFKFVGAGSDNPTEEIERVVRKLTNFQTLDESRIEMEMPPFGPPLGDIICNPTLIPFYEAMMGLNEPVEEKKSTSKKKSKSNKDKTNKAKNESKEKDRETKSANKKQRQAKNKR